MKDKTIKIIDRLIDSIIGMENFLKKPASFIKKNFSEIITTLAFVVLIFTMIGMKMDHAETMTELQNKYDNLSRNHITILEEIQELKEIVEMSQYEVSEIEEPTIEVVSVVEEEKSILEIAGEKYDIEPELLEAIERLESGHYTSTLYKAKNNSWGAFNGKEYKSFSSPEESTMELARVLREHYIDEGLNTIEKIGTKYCPDDGMWAYKVRTIYEKLKGGYVYG